MSNDTANHRGTYHEIRLALQQSLDEVELRITNNIQILRTRTSIENPSPEGASKDKDFHMPNVLSAEPSWHHGSCP